MVPLLKSNSDVHINEILNKTVGRLRALKVFLELLKSLKLI